VKIIHTADIHLGSKINSFPKEVCQARKEEVRNTFKRMVEYAVQSGVEVVLISGDLFDSDKPLVKDKDFFYSVVENNPSITFIYLRGNHDELSDGRVLPNLKTFTTNWQTYEFDNVAISGVETVKENATSIYSTLNLDRSKLNIVLMHGQIGDGSGYQKVNLSKLRDKGIDYLALGHIHEHSFGKIDERASYAYSGCLEGRGFDETGKKGFILLNIEDKITAQFIPFSEKEISLVSVDVSGLKDAYSIYLKSLAVGKFEKSGIYKVQLIGEVDSVIDGLESDLTKYLSSDVSYVEVKDLTKKKLNVKDYEYDASIKGEFVRVVLSDNTLTDEDKAQIISFGLKVLSGREI
jgi:DNA repair exonuclease SbcCD nuclease subunit